VIGLKAAIDSSKRDCLPCRRVNLQGRGPPKGSDE
jgi:hypothetical protein